MKLTKRGKIVTGIITGTAVVGISVAACGGGSSAPGSAAPAPDYTPSVVLASGGYTPSAALTSAFNQGWGSSESQYVASDEAGTDAAGDGEIVVALTSAAQSEESADISDVQAAEDISFPGTTVTGDGPDMIILIPAADLTN
jgi:hypothetical protein